MSSFWFMAGAVAITIAEMNEQAQILSDVQGLEELDLELPTTQQLIGEAMKVALQHTFALGSVAMDMATVNMLLASNSDYTVSEKAVGHLARLPCNLPCEDFASASNFGLSDDSQHDWAEWTIFDGHAGPRTAHELMMGLRSILAFNLVDGKCLGRPFVPNDPHIHDIIQRSFLDADQKIVQDMAAQVRSNDPDRAMVLSQIAVAHSGSCALMALFDPAQNVLRIANVGDSRAVLGRWDPAAGRYVAKLMSNDHTGFNPDEVERLQREHPGEDIIDPETGRIFGLAVTRAFGDARWKWPEAITRRAHERFWGPAPRPDGVVKTPPYLTAQPEITETRVDVGSEHPDFLILASDGLWDNISSDDAVTCVQMWLDQNRPDQFLDRDFQLEQEPLRLGETPVSAHVHLQSGASAFSTRSPVGEAGDFDDCYWDRSEGTLKWRVSPKHFVVEDTNCGEHLIKNALGGSRRGLLTSVMSVQPPLARKVRDDITVQVVFFGDYHRLEPPMGMKKT